MGNCNFKKKKNMNNIYHLHEKNISQKIIFNSKKNTFFFFFAKTLKNKISLSYHHLFINLKKLKQPPTLLFTTINNLKKPKQKRESSLLTHFELHTCFKNKKYIQKQTKQNTSSIVMIFKDILVEQKLVSRHHHHHHINSI